MILILSYPEDPHLPFVTRHVPKDNYVIIDITTLAKGATLHFSVDGSKVTIYYDGKLLENITGVWVRRPTLAADAELPVEERYLQYVRSAFNRAYEQLYALFPHAVWMSDNYNLRRANNKILQLQTAADVGLNVPRTILSSDKRLTREFITSRDTIMKPVATTYPTTSDGTAQLFYTTKIKDGTSLNLDGLHIAPTFFQEFIKPKHEIRTTVVGNEVFSATVRVDGQKANRHVHDWRYGYVDGSVLHDSYELDDETRKSCVALVKKLGLTFGACDFIEDEAGKLWFLEVNPNGQWAFIESATGLPIGKAIAELLIS